jgi:RNA polymerase sigma factor (sigma-70 family)
MIVSIVVHVVDDDASFRAAIGRLLQTIGYDVVMHESANDLIRQPPDDARPSCILLDVRMPGPSGLELQQQLHKLGSISPIIFLTGYGDIPTSVGAIKSGAEDFLTKPVSKSKLVDAIERAAVQYEKTRDQRERTRSLQALVAVLTPRERQVFQCVAQGKTNKAIAGELGTTERTIKAHRQKVMEKLKARSVSEIVLIAQRLGLLGEI